MLDLSVGEVSARRLGRLIVNDGKKRNKKPPCAECKRFNVDCDIWGVKYYLCDTEKKHPVSGNNIKHSCWWYRYSPFCKFEKKG